MIIARGTNDKAELLVLGLSHKNIEKLLEGKPMVLRRESHGDGIPEGWEICIFVGETEEAMARVLKEGGAIGPKTKFTREPKLNKES